MPFWKISNDVKVAAMRMYDADLLPLVTILDFLDMSWRTFFRVCALWIETGNVVRQTNGIKGWPRLLHFTDIDYLKCLIRHCPDWFLDELQYLLQTNQFMPVAAHFTTIHRELVHAGISNKKITKVASERNKNLRADFIAKESMLFERSFCLRMSFLCNWPSHTWWNGIKHCCGRVHEQGAFSWVSRVHCGLWCSFSRTLVHCLPYIDAIVFCISRSAECPCHG